MTATSDADSTQSATAVVFVLPSGQTYPAVPYPVAAHPRIWVTPEDVDQDARVGDEFRPNLFFAGNGAGATGGCDELHDAVFPGGQPSPNWPDPETCRDIKAL